MMRILFCGLLLLSTPAIAAQVRVVDTDGQPVDTFQIMWQTSHANCVWQNPRNGTWRESFDSDVDVINIIIRADGYASTVQQLQNELPGKLLNSEATITLSRGREVRIQLDLPKGFKVPSNFVMQSYFPQFKQRVRSMLQDFNTSQDEFHDWNMLNVRQVSENQFSMRLPPESCEFFLAFQHPGWLQWCELGPFSDEDIIDDVLRIAVPEPATIEVTFDHGSNAALDLPFDTATCMVYWVPDASGSIYRVTDDDVTIKPGEPLTLTDLGPGQYFVRVRTKARTDAINIEGTKINPGRFSEREDVILSSGELKTVHFSWLPFDSNAYRGDARARIAILRADGSVPVGRIATVSWYDGHYGHIVVHEGPIPSDGIVALNGISAKHMRGPAAFGQYTLAVDDKRLGFFTLKDTTKVQNFEFHITPGIGNDAPDISLNDVVTRRVSRLSDHRGKVVFLEFWSTGCGACQPAMRKLNHLAAEKPPDWHEKVTILSVSTDRDLDLVRDHVTNNGWNAIPHFVATREEGDYFSAAQTAYVILGVPAAVLIDQEGKIAWRGHPLDTTDGKSIADRIDLLLKHDASTSEQ